MKKNGFTLVELLAIILLLTILIVLVISNVARPLDSFNGTVNDSKLNVLLSAAKNYAEDNINEFAQCTYNKTLSNPSICVINPSVLVNEGYINEEDNLTVESGYSIIACYNSDNATISTFYKKDRNATCNNVESHRIQIEPQIVSVFYHDTVNLTSTITMAGNFNSISCEVSPDNVTRQNWATCSISSDNKSLNVQFYGQSEFPYISSQSLTIRIIGNYIDDNDNPQELTKNFRIVVFK